MSGHYRRGDPETGCGVMMLFGLLVVVMVIGGLVWLFAPFIPR